MRDYAVSQPNSIQRFSPRHYNPLSLFILPLCFLAAVSFSLPLPQVPFLLIIKAEKWNGELCFFQTFFFYTWQIDICSYNDVGAEISYQRDLTWNRSIILRPLLPVSIKRLWANLHRDWDNWNGNYTNCNYANALVALSFERC